MPNPTGRPFPFWKMHGAGNDFVVAETDRLDILDEAWGAFAIELCDRHQGVGADGLILVQPSKTADRKMRIFNADGSDGEMCVNGIRCFTKFCLDRGLVSAPDGRVLVETGPGLIPTTATRGADGRVTHVRVEAAVPDLDPHASGVMIDRPAPVLDFEVTTKDGTGASTQRVALVSMGNPHAVQFIDGSPSDYPLERIGPQMEHHPAFTHRTNYEVVRVLDRSHLEMRVWERGVGETQACGSGACAVMVAARAHGQADDDVQVSLPGGTLRIQWGGEGPESLTGPAAFVFEAEWTR